MTKIIFFSLVFRKTDNLPIKYRYCSYDCTKTAALVIVVKFRSLDINYPCILDNAVKLVF